jgi:hypothetical protein
MKIKVVFMSTLLASTLALMLVFGACSTTPKAKEKFIVDLMSPKVAMGTIEVQFDKMLAMTGIKKEAVNVEYYPKEDAVCLQYRIDFYNFNQFWSRDAREAFVKALENYKKDYEEKNFGKSSRKTKGQYGRVYSYLVWQMFQYTVQASANMNIEMGYYFKNKSPYFVVNQKEAVYEDPIVRDNNRTSQEIMMYFTRAQADELAALFDQQHLQGLAASTKIVGPNADYEEY